MDDTFGALLGFIAAVCLVVGGIIGWRVHASLTEERACDAACESGSGTTLSGDCRCISFSAPRRASGGERK